MAWWKRKEEVRADTELTQNENVTSEALLRALLDETTMTKKEALQIPTVASCIDIIAGTISSLPIKLYRQNGDKTEEIKSDRRLYLLNNDTGDTLTAKQFWRALLTDYYLDKGGYAYINKSMGSFKSLHFVSREHISAIKNEHPIFKDYDLYVHDKRYLPYEFFKILRKTTDGCTSTSIIEESRLIMTVAYDELVFEKNLVKRGGQKRGFLQTEKKLSRENFEKLRCAFKKLYNDKDENVVVLNEGIKFQEASNTSVEMQLNENKETNSNEISKLFGVPISIIKGNATQNDVDNYIKFCITPLINDIECSLDRDLLLEAEKEDHYFAFDTKELTRGNIKERYEAYEIGLRNNFLQPDEVRDKEDLEALGIEWIKLGLDSVLYNPKTKEIYTPNTNETVNINDLKRPKVGQEVKDDESGIES